MNFSTNGWIFTLFQGAGKSRGEATLLIDSPTAFPVYFLPTNRPTWRGSSGHPVSAQVLSYNNPTWTRSCPARMRGSIFVLIFITKICKYLCGLWEFVQLAVPLRKQGGGWKNKKNKKNTKEKAKGRAQAHSKPVRFHSCFRSISAAPAAASVLFSPRCKKCLEQLFKVNRRVCLAIFTIEWGSRISTLGQPHQLPQLFGIRAKLHTNAANEILLKTNT